MYTLTTNDHTPAEVRAIRAAYARGYAAASTARGQARYASGAGSDAWDAGYEDAAADHLEGCAFGGNVRAACECDRWHADRAERDAAAVAAAYAERNRADVVLGEDIAAAHDAEHDAEPVAGDALRTALAAAYVTVRHGRNALTASADVVASALAAAYAEEDDALLSLPTADVVRYVRAATHPRDREDVPLMATRVAAFTLAAQRVAAYMLQTDPDAEDGPDTRPLTVADARAHVAAARAHLAPPTETRHGRARVVVTGSAVRASGAGWDVYGSDARDALERLADVLERAREVDARADVLAMLATLA